MHIVTVEELATRHPNCAGCKIRFKRTVNSLCPDGKSRCLSCKRKGLKSFCVECNQFKTDKGWREKYTVCSMCYKMKRVSDGTRSKPKVRFVPDPVPEVEPTRRMTESHEKPLQLRCMPSNAVRLTMETILTPVDPDFPVLKVESAESYRKPLMDIFNNYETFLEVIKTERLYIFFDFTFAQIIIYPRKTILKDTYNNLIQQFKTAWELFYTDCYEDGSYVFDSGKPAYSAYTIRSMKLILQQLQKDDLQRYRNNAALHAFGLLFSISLDYEDVFCWLEPLLLASKLNGFGAHFNLQFIRAEPISCNAIDMALEITPITFHVLTTEYATLIRDKKYTLDQVKKISKTLTLRGEQMQRRVFQVEQADSVGCNIGELLEEVEYINELPELNTIPSYLHSAWLDLIETRALMSWMIETVPWVVMAVSLNMQTPPPQSSLEVLKTFDLLQLTRFEEFSMFRFLALYFNNNHKFST